MITLFHAPQSRSSRILWLLEELSLPYSIEYVTITRMDGSGGPDARNPHPDKKVPAIVHDGALITESSAICLYLADLAKQSPVAVPEGDPQRGAFVSWLAYYGGVIEPVVTLEMVGLGSHPGLQRTFRSRAEVEQRILAALQAGPWALGERFTAVDVLIASLGHWARKMLPADPAIDAFLQRANARPALQRAMQKDSGG